MYAIVEIAGKQYKVQKDARLYVNSLDLEEGQKISFDKVMLVDSGSKISVGAPFVENASVEASLLRQVKGDKVIVFKKKRRKGYQVKNGHRQPMSELKIENIKA